jgi:hypothetical protein
MCDVRSVQRHGMVAPTASWGPSSVRRALHTGSNASTRRPVRCWSVWTPTPAAASATPPPSLSAAHVTAALTSHSPPWRIRCVAGAHKLVPASFFVLRIISRITAIQHVFASAYPATGSFSHTALNAASGVATQLAGVLTGVVVLVVVAALTPLFYRTGGGGGM